MADEDERHWERFNAQSAELFEAVAASDTTLNLSVGGQKKHRKIKSGTQEHVSTREFYASFAMIRDEAEGHSNHLHRFGKLFQQYLVDQYAKVESTALSYMKHELGPELMTAYYGGLMDAIETDTLHAIGTPTILHPSFVNGPRAYHARFQDAMSIVREYGKPDLFITMTCNPKWREIQEAMEMFPHMSSYDCPDIVCRVFHQKINELLKDLLERDIFGKVIGHVEVIEFQKRGLPHCHILLILDKQSKLKSSDDYDAVVSAEIPDPKHERLHALVLQHMIHHHGPACMRDNFCSKWFPKDFCPSTRTEESGYPLYRRRSPRNVCFACCTPELPINQMYFVIYRVARQQS